MNTIRWLIAFSEHSLIDALRQTRILYAAEGEFLLARVLVNYQDQAACSILIAPFVSLQRMKLHMGSYTTLHEQFAVA